MTPETMKRGGKYHWKNQPEQVIYLQKLNGWHQFKKIGDPRDVWCEVRDQDLHRIEETVEPPIEKIMTLADDYATKTMAEERGSPVSDTDAARAALRSALEQPVYPFLYPGEMLVAATLDKHGVITSTRIVYLRAQPAAEPENQPPIRTGGSLNIPDVVRRAAIRAQPAADTPTDEELVSLAEAAWARVKASEDKDWAIEFGRDLLAKVKP